MGKKAGKYFLIGLGAAATAAGVYYLLQNKDKIFKKDNGEFIDGDGTCDSCDETATGKKERSYVSLDMNAAKAKVEETFNKTISKAQEAFKAVENKIESVRNGNSPIEVPVETVCESEATGSSSEDTISDEDADPDAAAPAEDENITDTPEETADEESETAAEPIYEDIRSLEDTINEAAEEDTISEAAETPVLEDTISEVTEAPVWESASATDETPHNPEQIAPAEDCIVQSIAEGMDRAEEVAEATSNVASDEHVAEPIDSLEEIKETEETVETPDEIDVIEEAIDAPQDAKIEEAIDTPDDAEPEEAIDTPEDAESEEAIDTPEDAESEEAIDAPDDAESEEAIDTPEDAESEEAIDTPEDAESEEVVDSPEKIEEPDQTDETSDDDDSFFVTSEIKEETSELPKNNKSVLSDAPTIPVSEDSETMSNSEEFFSDEADE